MELPKMESRYPPQLENHSRFTPANMRRSPESRKSSESSLPRPDHPSDDKSPPTLPRLSERSMANHESKAQNVTLPPLKNLLRQADDEALLTPPNSGELPKKDDFRGSPQRADSADHPLFSANSSANDRYPLFSGESAAARRSTCFNSGSVRHSPDEFVDGAQSVSMERSASQPESTAHGDQLQSSRSPRPAESLEVTSRKPRSTANSKGDPRRVQNKVQRDIHRHQTTTKSMFADVGVQSPGQEDYRLVADFTSRLHSAMNFAPPTEPTNKGRSDYPPHPGSEEESPRFHQYHSYDREHDATPPRVRHGIPETSVNVIDGRQYGPIMPPRQRESSPDRYGLPQYAETTPIRSPGRKRVRVDSSSLEPEPFTSRKRRSSSDPSQGRRRNGGSPMLNKDGRHARNRSTKEKKSSNYSDYEDWAPSWESMHEPIKHAQDVKALDVKNPVDLANDQLRDELHRSEIIVSTRLNLNCETYLLVKRQMFTRFKHYLEKHDGNWNKTAAQKASNLDVGKISALFVFYQNVGWFNSDLYEDKVEIDPASASACSFTRKSQPAGQE